MRKNDGYRKMIDAGAIENGICSGTTDIEQWISRMIHLGMTVQGFTVIENNILETESIFILR
jgi:hypothetical protein